MLPKTWVGWVIYVAGALVALVLGGIALLLVALPRVELKDDFEREMERIIGRDVEIAGDLDVTFFPVFGFRANDVTIANAPGGSAAFLAQAAEVNAGMEILPYIFGRNVVVDRMILRNPHIHLELDTQGRPNWNLVPQGGQQPSPRPPSRNMRDMELREVRIEGGRIDYLDQRDGDTWAIIEPDLRTAVTSLDEPMSIVGSLEWRGERVIIDATIAQPRMVLNGRPANVQATVESGPLGARFNGTLSGSGEYFTGTVSALGPSLRRVTAWIGAAIAPGAGFEAFEVRGTLTATNQRIAFENATLVLDSVQARGDFTFESHNGRPYVSGRLEFPSGLDINPYLAPPPAAGADVPTVEVAAAGTVSNAPDARRPWPTEAIDLAALKTLDANLELTINQSFRFLRMAANRAVVSMVLNEGYLAATIQRIELYGGAGSGRLEIDAREPVLRVAQELNLQGVRVQDFLRDAANFRQLEGPAEVTIDWAGQGASQDAIFSSLRGRVTVRVANGALRGVDLGGVARTIQNAISGELVNPNARTTFSNLTATFAIAGGVMASDDFSVATPDLRIDGLGIINLGEQQLVMRIVPREGGVAIPFVVRGPWARLEYASDLRGRERPGIQAQVRDVQGRAPPAR